MIRKLNESDSLKFKNISQEEKAKRGILGRLYGQVASCVNPTRNERKYSEALWENLFQSDLIKERFANGGIFGQLNHPDYEEVDMEKIAIVMPEPPVKDKNGQLVAYVDIVDTPCGRIAYQLAKYGYKFGISSRGTGDLIEGADGSEVDPDTYQLNAFDLVEIPAVENARLSFVESIQTKKRYNKTLKESLSEELNKASEEDRKIMEETLSDLDIKLDESTDQLYDAVFDSDDIPQETIPEPLTIIGDMGNGFYIVRGTAEAIADAMNADPQEVVDAADQRMSIISTVKGSIEEKVDADLQGIKPKKAGKFETSLPKGSVKRINDIVSEMDEEDFELLNDNAWDAYLDKNEEALAIVKPILRKYHLPMWALMVFVESWDEFDEALDPYKLESGTLRGELTRLVRTLKEEIPEADKDDFNREFKTALKNVFGDLEEELDLSNEDDFGIHDELVHKLYNAIKVAIKDFIPSGHSSIADLDDSDIERAAEEAIMRLTDGINEECNNESCADKEEEKEEVVNDESEIVAQLQESLIQTKKLADDNLSLQEKLSVCNAKEVKLEEELKQKTNAVINLSDKAKEVKPLTEKVNKLTETLARKDDVIKANRSRLEIMVEKKKELSKQLDESLSDNTNLQSQVDNLNDQLESLNSKLNESKETIKKYQKAYASLKESYLDSKADAYGIKKEAVKANLKESYSVKDIDLVCESLANEKKAMSKLPFRINEGASIKASQSKDYSIKMKDKRSSDDDDFVSDSLLRMIK